MWYQGSEGCFWNNDQGVQKTNVAAVLIPAKLFKLNIKSLAPMKVNVEPWASSAPHVQMIKDAQAHTSTRKSSNLANLLKTYSLQDIFPAFKWLKTYLSNTVGQKCLNRLALLCPQWYSFLSWESDRQISRKKCQLLFA